MRAVVQLEVGIQFNYDSEAPSWYPLGRTSEVGVMHQASRLVVRGNTSK